MLLLDSEALSAIANGPPRRRRVALTLMREARKREQQVATSAAVLAEVIRGRPRDAGVRAALRRETVVIRSVDAEVAARAGELLQAIGSGSEKAVDAFLVATGDRKGAADVLTTDTRDMRYLADHTTNVSVIDLDHP